MKTVCAICLAAEIFLGNGNFRTTSKRVESESFFASANTSLRVCNVRLCMCVCVCVRASARVSHQTLDGRAVARTRQQFGQLFDGVAQHVDVLGERSDAIEREQFRKRQRAVSRRAQLLHQPTITREVRLFR